MSASTRRYKEGWHQGIGMRVEDVKVGNVDDDAPKEIKEFEGHNFLTGVKYDFGRTLPTISSIPPKAMCGISLTKRFTGVDTFGIFNAHRTDGIQTLNEDLAERKTVLGTKLRFGQIVGDAPPFEKFYAGGTQSIRGFEYRGVSTRGYPDISRHQCREQKRR